MSGAAPAKVIGLVRLGRVRSDMAEIAEALSVVKAGDKDCASLLNTAALRLDVQAAHLRQLSTEISQGETL